MLDIKYVAHLARLHLSEKDIGRFSGQLEEILKYINQLSEVDVTGIEPTCHVFAQKNIVREDGLKPSLPVSEVLQNAPAKEREFFKVPKIIE